MEELNNPKLILQMDEEQLDYFLEKFYERIMAKNKVLPEIIDGEEAQGILKVGRTSLFKLRTSGKIPYYKMGGTIVYKRSEIMEYINEHKHDKF